MDETTLTAWLNEYGRAWEARDPDRAAALFSEDARYYEDPFGAPAHGRDGIRAYWANATGRQTDVTFSHDRVCVSRATAVARWAATFTRTPGGTAARLDGVFVLRFDGDGLCRELREWWHIVETPAQPPQR